jgi:hypothetical protein
MLVLLLIVNLYTDNQTTVGEKSVLKLCYGYYTGAGRGCCCIIGAGIKAKDYNHEPDKRHPYTCHFAKFCIEAHLDVKNRWIVGVNGWIEFTHMAL